MKTYPMIAAKMPILPLLAWCAIFFSILPAATNGAERGDPLATGRFGRALDATHGPAIVMPCDAYAEMPFTVECWVLLRDATARNTILSSESTNSGGHWALFSAADSGALGVTLTGRTPGEVQTERNIADGAWHHLALILGEARVQLLVDGQEVAVRTLERNPKPARRAGWLVLGGTADRPEAKCAGRIDEVRISRGVRKIASLPATAPEVDAATVGLWHLDEISADGETADASSSGSPAWLAAGRSMDEIDRLSFKAGPSPLDAPAQTVALVPGAAVHPAPVLDVSLDSPSWVLAEGGSEADRLSGDWSDGIAAAVPGSVHSALFAAGKIPDPKFGRNDAIANAQSFKTWWFKRSFPRPRHLTATRLVFDGVAIHCTVWLNGTRLGEHEGMFGGPSFDVAGLLRDENTLIVRIDPAPYAPGIMPGAADNGGWKSTVVFNNVWGWHYSNIPALGIWRSVRIEDTPAVRVAHPFVATRDAAAGEVSLMTDLQGAATGWSGTLTVTIEPDNFTGPAHHFTRKVTAAGAIARLHLRFRIPAPRLWWPNDLGGQNLYRMKLSFMPEGGGLADFQQRTFGVRTIAMAPLPGGPRADRFDWTFVVNGRPVFIKGTGWCTMDSSMDFSRGRYERLISLAKLQHVQMLRGWGSGMPETDDFYDLCDRAGILVMQEWPTAWNSHRVQPYDVLAETVRLNTLRLRHHASLAMWGGGNESDAPFGPAIDMMGRLATELDGTRPFHRGEPFGGSLHNYNCYWGRQPLDHNLRMKALFWGEFGLPSLPALESVRRYLPAAEQDLWPAPADGSLAHHTPVFNKTKDLERLQQYSGYFSAGATLADFIRGSQLSQVVGLRHTLERARTRWPDCTGALYYKMNDNYPAASWAVVDWYGAPKPAHYVCQQAFAPLHAAVIFDSVNNQGKDLALPVFLLDDADALKGARWDVAVRAYDGKLRLIKEETYSGAGSVTAPRRLGEFGLTALQTDTTPLFVVAEVRKDGVLADRTFWFVNYEAEKDSLFKLPRTTLSLKEESGAAVVTNTGPLPAVAVEVRRPGHSDSFTAGENFLWLEPGETKRIPVNVTDGLMVEAWNAGSGPRTPAVSLPKPPPRSVEPESVNPANPTL